MFSLFAGKISSVFTMLYQGISKVVGLVVETVANVIDTVTDIATTITAPIIDKLTDLPLLGGVVESVNNFAGEALGNISETLHTAADQFTNSNLAGGAQTLLDGATNLVGDTVDGLRDLLGDTTQALSPVTDVLGDLPLIGGVLEAVTDTTDNLLGFVGETADYVADISPVELIGGLLNNPVGTVGGVISDVSGSLDSLLDDLAPVTDAVAQIPVVGQVVEHLGHTAGYVPDALGFLGAGLQQAPSFSDLFNWTV